MSPKHLMDNYLRGFGHALLLASALVWLTLFLGGCGTGTQDDCNVFPDAPYCRGNL